MLKSLFRLAACSVAPAVFLWMLLSVPVAGQEHGQGYVVFVELREPHEANFAELAQG